MIKSDSLSALAPIMTESEATTTQHAAAWMTGKDSGKDAEGLPNPGTSHSEAMMMTQREATPQMTGSRVHAAGLSNPD